MEPMWISVDDVVKTLLGLKVSSAAGGDGVHPQLLKSWAGLLALPLLQIFVMSPRSRRLPSAWKWSVVVPLFKAGSRCLQNYRPVM